MSTPCTPLALTSQVTLATSLIAYPLLFFLVTPRSATPSRFAKSREAISALHCTLVTLASIYVLQRQYSAWGAYSLSPSLTENEKSAAAPDARPGAWAGGAGAGTRTGSLGNGADSALITTRSAFGNSITALETGYMVQDAVILVLGARLRTRYPDGGGKSLAKEINWRVLGWHHAGLSSVLVVLQWYIAHGRERGILVILMLMLMNASYVEEHLTSS